MDSREKRNPPHVKFLLLRNAKQEMKEKLIKRNVSPKFVNTKTKMNVTKAEYEIVKYGNTFAFGFVLDILKQEKKKKKIVANKILKTQKPYIPK